MSVIEQKKKKYSGFSLIEVLSAVIIIMVLAGMISVAVIGARRKALKQAQKVERATLAAALWEYRYEYQKWPAHSSGTHSNIFMEDNYIIIKGYLLPDGAYNPNKVTFIDKNNYKFDAKGNVCDWKLKPYKITFYYADDTVSVAKHESYDEDDEDDDYDD